MTTLEERVSRLEVAQEHNASKADVARTEGELKTAIANLKTEMRAMELRITLRLGGLMIGIAGVMTAVIVAALRFL